VSGGGVEQAHGLFHRVYETVAIHLHERAASSFLRAQAIVDTVTAGNDGRRGAVGRGAGGQRRGGRGRAQLAAERDARGGGAARGQGSDALREGAGEDAGECEERFACGSVQIGRSSAVAGCGDRRAPSERVASATAPRSRSAPAPAGGSGAVVQQRSTGPRAGAAAADEVRGRGTSAISEFGFAGP
jgi:hypothetical protein